MTEIEQLRADLDTLRRAYTAVCEERHRLEQHAEAMAVAKERMDAACLDCVHAGLDDAVDAYRTDFPAKPVDAPRYPVTSSPTNERWKALIRAVQDCIDAGVKT